MFKALSKRGRKKPDTKKIKNAKMWINKKIGLMSKNGWEKSSLRTILSEKFKVKVGKIESIDIARDMYEYLIWLTYLAKGKAYKKKRKSIE